MADVVMALVVMNDEMNRICAAGIGCKGTKLLSNANSQLKIN